MLKNKSATHRRLVRNSPVGATTMSGDHGQQRPSPEKAALGAMVLVGQLGLVVVTCVGGGVAMGLYLEKKLGGSGLFLVVMILLGVGAGLYGAYRLLAKEIPWNH